MIAAQEAGLDARAFSFAVQRALWAEDRDIADLNTLRELACATIGEVGAALVSEPLAAEIRAIWEGNLAEAVRLGIFGTPTYVYRGELFWGQDRLEFLEQAIRNAKVRSSILLGSTNCIMSYQSLKMDQSSPKITIS